MKRQSGISLLEVVIAMTVLSFGLAGILAQPAASIQMANINDMRQAQMIADAKLDEVLSKSMAWCAESDPAFSTASSFADCTTPKSSSPVSTGPANYPYTHVIDLGNYSSAGVYDAANNDAGLGAYAVQVLVTQEALGGAVSTADTLKITVLVSSNTAAPVTAKAEGWRTRYAGNQ